MPLNKETKPNFQVYKQADPRISTLQLSKEQI